MFEHAHPRTKSKNWRLATRTYERSLTSCVVYGSAFGRRRRNENVRESYFLRNGLLHSAHTPHPCVVWVLPVTGTAPRKVPDAAGDGSRQACREISIAPIVYGGN